MQFKTKKPQYEFLRKKWIIKHQSIDDNLWKKHGDVLKNFTAGALGGLLLLASPVTHLLPHSKVMADTTSSPDAIKNYDKNVLFVTQLKERLPTDVINLNTSEEQNIIDILSKKFNLKLKPEIDGIKLNRNYGIIGGEQHLYRYPGDNLYAHADNTLDWAKYGNAGIAPNLGAWGYFAQSKEAMTEQDKLREQYYIAVQTFLTPGYAENVDKYRDFFKYRKVLVVNPENGQAVVTDIADAGPGESTGKHLGGAPRVMDALGLGEGMRKGGVLYFFIEDPKDEVALGPIEKTNE